MQVAAGASPSRSYRSSRREYMPVAWMGEGEGEVQNVTDSSLHAHRAAAPGTRRRSLCTCYAGDRPSQRLAFSQGAGHSSVTQRFAEQPGLLCVEV
jgi:hypothetical protein